jgi:RNA polymerase sigma factor (sigma-70 family)
MPDVGDEPDWLGAYREGRRDALERVYRAYVRPIERYLRSLARSHSCPELGQASAIADFLQEVFTRTFSASARRNYDGRRDFGAYVAVIARNCFVDALRARGRETLLVWDEANLQPDEASCPLDDSLDPRVRTVLTAYVTGLPTDLRQVYEQRFADGCSQDAACAALGLSRRTLRTKEDHLRKGLRRALVRAGVSLSELREPQAEFGPGPLVALLPTSRSQP